MSSYVVARWAASEERTADGRHGSAIKGGPQPPSVGFDERTNARTHEKRRGTRGRARSGGGAKAGRRVSLTQQLRNSDVTFRRQPTGAPRHVSPLPTPRLPLDRPSCPLPAVPPCHPWPRCATRHQPPTKQRQSSAQHGHVMMDDDWPRPGNRVAGWRDARKRRAWREAWGRSSARARQPGVPGATSSRGNPAPWQPQHN